MVEIFEREAREAIKQTLIDKHKSVNNLKRWERYRELRNATLPEPGEVISEIQDVAKFNLKIAAAFSLLLLTGSRIGEITRYKYVWVKNELTREDGTKPALSYEKYKELKNITGQVISKPSIRIGDIQTKEDRDKQWVVIRTRVEKKHDVQNTHYKHAWLLYDETEYYFPLLKIVEEYIDELLNNDNPATELFTFSNEHLRKKMSMFLGINPHLMRSYCAKYLVRYKHFTVQDLMRWFNWESAEQAIGYSESDEDIIQKRMLGIDLK